MIINFNESLLFTPSQNLFTHPSTPSSPDHYWASHLNRLRLILNEPLWRLKRPILHNIFASEATKIQDCSPNKYSNIEVWLRSPFFKKLIEIINNRSYEGLYLREANRLPDILRHVRVHNLGKAIKIQQHDVKLRHRHNKPLSSIIITRPGNNETWNHFKTIR